MHTGQWMDVPQLYLTQSFNQLLYYYDHWTFNLIRYISIVFPKKMRKLAHLLINPQPWFNTWQLIFPGRAVNSSALQLARLQSLLALYHSAGGSWIAPQGAMETLSVDSDPLISNDLFVDMVRHIQGCRVLCGLTSQMIKMLKQIPGPASKFTEVTSSWSSAYSIWGRQYWGDANIVDCICPLQAEHSRALGCMDAHLTHVLCTWVSKQ